ncbi:MAG: group III truncated hemoglobin [Chitinophagaceae bacterium]|nr:group III truncated hemoglobin [Chitinophagaceae bacterium]
MVSKKDISTLEDIKILVDDFYGRVRKDELLAPIFDERIRDRWLKHLERMYTFWQTMLLDEHTYFSSPFPPHATLPVKKEHFERWLSLFSATLDEFFEGEVREKAMLRATKMAEMFQFKIGQIRESHRRL